MRSMKWQLGISGTISAFAYRHKETKKNLCRDGRSQDPQIYKITNPCLTTGEKGRKNLSLGSHI